MQALVQELLANLTWDRVLGLANYWVAIILVGIGLFSIITQTNFIKKIIGLAVFQGGVFILYISLGKVTGGTAPIIKEGMTVYSNPLPHVLILTAIVVGIATTAVALSLVIRIREAYGSIEEDEVLFADRETDQIDSQTNKQRLAQRNDALQVTAKSAAAQADATPIATQSDSLVSNASNPDSTPS